MSHSHSQGKPADQPLQLFGSNASPYSCKLRAILRYRHIAHQWRVCMPALAPEFADLKLKLMPLLRDPASGEYLQESTTIALQLEQQLAERSIMPPSPGEQFLCYLIEDFADEWCTKIMFYYRWIDAQTAAESAAWIVDDTMSHMQQQDPAARSARINMIEQRQRQRMTLVGVGPDNAAVIERCFIELLSALKPLAEAGLFLFGTRPSLADFGLYGQLQQLATDSLPRQQVMERAIALRHWLTRLDDASGISGDWQEHPVGQQSRQALLAMTGQYYLPFLQANAEALARGDEQFSFTLGDDTFRQAPFGWQEKCRQQILQRWQQLTPSQQGSLNETLREAGCLEWLTTHSETRDGR